MLIAPANNQITKFTLPRLAAGDAQNGTVEVVAAGDEGNATFATTEAVRDVGIIRMNRRRPKQIISQVSCGTFVSYIAEIKLIKCTVRILGLNQVVPIFVFILTDLLNSSGTKAH